jgi:hypothetical protein
MHGRASSTGRWPDCFIAGGVLGGLGGIRLARRLAVYKHAL